MSITDRLSENLTKANDFIAANTKLLNALGHTAFAGSVLRTGLDIAGYSQSMGILETLYGGVAGLAAVKLSKIIESKYDSESLIDKGYKGREDLKLFEVNTIASDKFKDKIREQKTESSMSPS